MVIVLVSHLVEMVDFIGAFIKVWCKVECTYMNSLHTAVVVSVRLVHRNIIHPDCTAILAPKKSMAADVRHVRPRATTARPVGQSLRTTSWILSTVLA